MEPNPFQRPELQYARRACLILHGSRFGEWTYEQ
jgi:hypothetical protein